MAGYQLTRRCRDAGRPESVRQRPSVGARTLGILGRARSRSMSSGMTEPGSQKVGARQRLLTEQDAGAWPYSRRKVREPDARSSGSSMVGARKVWVK